MKYIFLIVLVSFYLVELAHLNYHRHDKRLNGAQPAVNFDRNF